LAVGGVELLDLARAVFVGRLSVESTILDQKKEDTRRRFRFHTHGIVPKSVRYKFG
jgi:hypothetical protein